MLCLMTLESNTDGGYPADSDLHRMTDDGAPLSPDPIRWADPRWGDNAVDSSVHPVQDLVSSVRWERLMSTQETRRRWRTACEQLIRY